MTDQKNNEPRPLDWDTYYETRKNFDEIRISQLNAFDKAILTISSSALAFSVVILTTFSGRGPILHLNYITFSWISFSIAIVINLVSYLLAAKSVDKEIGELDDSISSGSHISSMRNRFVRLTDFANIAAILMFICGVFFCCFSHLSTVRLVSKMSKIKVFLGVATRPFGGEISLNGSTTSGPPVAKPTANSGGSSPSSGKPKSEK